MKNNTLYSALCAAAVLLTSLNSCQSGESSPDQTGSGEKDGYKVVWADYFDDGVLDDSKWTCEENGDGGGNAELQYYSPDNVSVTREDGRGCLKIEARREEYDGKAFTSGRINTEGKFAFTYGKVEASIKLPQTADGLWPAFWLLGADIRSNPWPGCGEIDILEVGHADGIVSGTQSRYFNGAGHWGRYVQEEHPQKATHNIAPYSIQDGQFHLYTLIWESGRLAAYLDLDKNPDAEPYFTLDITPGEDVMDAGKYFHHDFFLLFNLAVGGLFTGILDPDKISALDNGPGAMFVDYVKVYQIPT